MNPLASTLSCACLPDTPAARPAATPDSGTLPAKLTLAHLNDQCINLLQPGFGDKTALQSALAAAALELLGRGALTLEPVPDTHSGMIVGHYRNDPRIDHERPIRLEIRSVGCSRLELVSITSEPAHGQRAEWSLPLAHQSYSSQALPTFDFERLPTELRIAVLNEALLDSKVSRANDLYALRRTSKAMNAMFIGTEGLAPAYRSYQRASQTIVQLVDSLTSEQVTSIGSVELFRMMSMRNKQAYLAEALARSPGIAQLTKLAGSLEALEPGQRTQILDRISMLIARRSAPPQLLVQLGASLHVDPARQSMLLEGLEHLEPCKQGHALQEIGENLADLDDGLFEQVVNKVLTAMSREHGQGFAPALAGLVKTLPALSLVQHKQTLTSVMEQLRTLSPEPALIEGFTWTLHSLSPDEQSELVDVVVDRSLRRSTTREIVTLARAVQHAPDHAYVHLISELALGVQRFSNACIPHGHWTNDNIQYREALAIARAFGSLGGALRPGPFPECSAIADVVMSAILQIPDERCQCIAIADLDAGMPALAPTQRSALLAITLRVTDEDAKSVALAGLGAGLWALTHEEQASWLCASLELKRESVRTKAIGGLSATALQELTFTQQTRLVSAALAMTQQACRSRALSTLHHVTAPDQYLRVIEGISALEDRPDEPLPGLRSQALARLIQKPRQAWRPGR